MKGLKRVGKTWKTTKELDVRELAENVEKVRTLVRSDRRLSVRMMAEELKLYRETVRKILSGDLGLRKWK